LNPDSIFAHRMFGNSLALRRRFAESIAHLEQARSQDPEAISIVSELAFAYMYSGKSDLAEAEFRRALEINRDHFPAQWGLGELYIRTKKFDLALGEMEAACHLDDSPEARAELAYCLARLERRTEAQAILDDLARGNDRRYVPPAALAIAQIGLARHED